MLRIPEDIMVRNIERCQIVILYSVNAEFFSQLSLCVCVCVVGGCIQTQMGNSDKKLFWVYGRNILDAFLIPGEI